MDLVAAVVLRLEIPAGIPSSPPMKSPNNTPCAGVTWGHSPSLGNHSWRVCAVAMEAHAVACEHGAQHGGRATWSRSTLGDRSRSRGAIRQSRRLGRLTTGWPYATTREVGARRTRAGRRQIIYFLKDPRGETPNPRYNGTGYTATNPCRVASRRYYDNRVLVVQLGPTAWKGTRKRPLDTCEGVVQKRTLHESPARPSWLASLARSCVSVASDLDDLIDPRDTLRSGQQRYRSDRWRSQTRV